jgi:putative colanic acid biosynthesis UDP-glucose lipid carrier transferase
VTNQIRKRMAPQGTLHEHGNVVGAFQRIADGLNIAFAHVLACAFYGIDWRPELTTTTAIAVVSFAFIGEATGLYRAWRSETLSAEVKHVALTWLLVVTVLLTLAFATKSSTDYSRLAATGWFLGAPVMITCLRLGTRLLLRALRSHGRNTRRVAIYGATPGAHQIRRGIEAPYLGMQLAGVYDDRGDIETDLPLVGDLEDLVREARAGSVDIIYVALPLREEERINEILRALADTTANVYLVADFFTFDLLNARWSMLDRTPVVSVYESPFLGPAGLLKRIEDIVVGTLICALISLPMLAIAAAIKLTSKGPVFFRQRRYGLNGKEIRVLKFRSMTCCDDGPVVKQATRNDVRVTPLGRFLRRTSLDELPQFLQVLTGEMSIVGPRPHAVAHNEEYRSLIHGYMLRHKVKPGITGWAQINGWRGETDHIEKMEKRVEHDLQYIQNWNLLWDLKIIAMTVVGSKKSDNAF